MPGSRPPPTGPPLKQSVVPSVQSDTLRWGVKYNQDHTYGGDQGLKPPLPVRSPLFWDHNLLTAPTDMSLRVSHGLIVLRSTNKVHTSRHRWILRRHIHLRHSLHRILFQRSSLTSTDTQGKRINPMYLLFLALRIDHHHPLLKYPLSYHRNIKVARNRISTLLSHQPIIMSRKVTSRTSTLYNQLSDQKIRTLPHHHGRLHPTHQPKILLVIPQILASSYIRRLYHR